MEAFLFARARGGMKLGLERMERALAQLGHPERAAPAFHVAGTNGKGSVCAFLESACRASGRRTALYTSPHLERFAERFRVDGEPLPDDALLETYAELRARLPWAFADGPEGLTFFELVTLLGFVALAKSRPEATVVEVGLGGRLDATNTVQPLVTCVTPVGLEHQEFLGHTLDAIASEKAGIAKAGVPLVTARQEPEALAAIARRAAEVGSPLSVEGPDFTLEPSGGALAYVSDRGRLSGVTLGLAGAHQRSNAAVALRALELAAERGLEVAPGARRTGLAGTAWPGRLERVRARPEVVLDGAHNPHAAVALAAAVRQLYAGRTLHLVLGLLADKDGAPMLELLVPLARDVLATQPSSPRALDAHALAKAMRRLHPRVEVEVDPRRAIDRAIAAAAPTDLVLACGSLYLVGEMRAHLRGAPSGGPSELLR